MRRRIGPLPAVVVTLALVAAGCQKKVETPPQAAAPAPPKPAPFKVTGLELGKALTAEHRVAAPMTSFAPRDTIYAVVSSSGETKGTMLRVRWTFQDTLLVAAESLLVTTTGPQYTEFHIVRTPKWKPGTYEFAVKADTAFAGAQKFDVK